MIPCLRLIRGTLVVHERPLEPLMMQDVISPAPGITMKSLGLCSGDVVWVLGNVLAGPQAPAPAKKARSDEVAG